MLKVASWRLVAALGCGLAVLAPAAATAAGARSVSGPLDSLFSIFAPQDPAPSAGPHASPMYPYDGASEPAQRKDTGAYRTVCVRTCDGFYWPVSDAAPVSRFQRDKTVCEASCAQPAHLYYQPAGAADAGKLVGLDGKPYSALARAFAYRKSLDASCRCKADPWSQSEVERHRLYALNPETALPAATAAAAATVSTDEYAVPVEDTDIQAGNPAAVAFADYPSLDLSPATKSDPQDPINMVVLPPLTHTHSIRKARKKPAAAAATPAAANSGPVHQQPVDGAGQFHIQLR